MKTLLMAASVLLTGPNSYGANIVGSGKKITKFYPVKGVEQVEVNGFFKVNISKGKTSKLKITGDDNLVPHIKTEMDGNRLKVYMNLDYDGPTPFEVDLSSSKLSEYVGHGNVDTIINGYDEKHIAVSMTGNSFLDLQKSVVESLSLNMIGKSEAYLGPVAKLTGESSKGLNKVSLLRKTNVSGLHQAMPSTIIYR